MLTGHDDGRQVVDANGLPVTQWTDTAGFEICVPKGKMPAKGFPLYFWVHGTGGDPTQFADRGRVDTNGGSPPPGSGMASYLSPRGWAGACAAGPLSPTRIGMLSAQGYIAYDFFNPVSMRDNFVQMILEMVLFRRLVLNLRIDPKLCPGTDASASIDGKIGFDPDTMIVGGQSLGSYLAGMLAALLPDWKGCVLTGAGGSWVEFPFGPSDPVRPATIIDTFALPSGEHVDQFHPYVMAFDLALGPADNTHYLEKVQRDPLPGHNPPHVLIIEGHGDLQVPENLQRCDILAIGTDLVGPEILPNPLDEQDAPCLPWGGLQQLPYPVQGNRTLANGLVRTAVVTRYEHDTVGRTDGHYVTYQFQAPKDQIGEFASDISAGRVPNVVKH
jgi:pimeloyl-ACP methyl ester carboxylesterase